MVNAVVPALDRQVLELGLPETIGCPERMCIWSTTPIPR